MTDAQRKPRLVGVTEAVNDTGMSPSWCRERLRRIALQLGRDPNEKGALLIPRATWKRFLATKFGTAQGAAVKHKQRPCVYFIQFGATGPIKIGTAVNIAMRLSTLQVACPEELRVILTVDGGEYAEERLHARFSELRIRGEWFRPASELLEFVERIRSAGSVDAGWWDE